MIWYALITIESLKKVIRKSGNRKKYCEDELYQACPLVDQGNLSAITSSGSVQPMDENIVDVHACGDGTIPSTVIKSSKARNGNKGRKKRHDTVSGDKGNEPNTCVLHSAENVNDETILRSGRAVCKTPQPKKRK